MDFGTRRRFSRDVQFAIVSTLQRDFPAGGLQQLRHRPSARHYAGRHSGARMVPGASADQSGAGQQPAGGVAGRLDEYDDKLGIALTDCITMDAFLRDFGPGFANRYQGLRHDSGDPVEWGEKALAHYEKLAIDPHSKTLVFSDNLDFNKAIDLYRHFGQRTNVVFGIGTRLTCDIPQVKPLNIVIKLVECNGKPVAKLSDSPGKTICQDKAFVRALRKAFDLPLVKSQLTRRVSTFFRVLTLFPAAPSD